MGDSRYQQSSLIVLMEGSYTSGKWRVLNGWLL